MGEAPSAWVSAHLFCHTDLDALLMHAVRPAVTELAESKAIGGFFFLRYWDGGPHIRLRLSVADPAAIGLIRTTIDQKCGSYLREHRAVEPIGQVRYARTASELARLEGVTRYRRDPYPDGTLRFFRYHREYSRYGDEAVMAAVEQHLMAASIIALSLVCATTRAQRRAAAFCMTLLAALSRDARRQVGMPWPEPADWSRQYEEQRGRLRILANHCRTLAGSGADPAASASGALPAWYRTLRSLGEELALLRPRHTAAPSSLILSHCTHLMCNRLGIALGDEAFVRYLVTRALAEQPRAEGTGP
jgi:hypothetical protein